MLIYEMLLIDDIGQDRGWFSYAELYDGEAVGRPEGRILQLN